MILKGTCLFGKIESELLFSIKGQKMDVNSSTILKQSSESENEQQKTTNDIMVDGMDFDEKIHFKIFISTLGHWGIPY